jgi:hypothetical protein
MRMLLRGRPDRRSILAWGLSSDHRRLAQPPLATARSCGRTRATISAGDESALDAQRDGDGPLRPALNGGSR